jgi:hypothetical protein
MPKIDYGVVAPPESLADFGRWLNEWGDLFKHEDEYSKSERLAYEQAISDAYDYFDNLYPNWPKET